MWFIRFLLLLDQMLISLISQDNWNSCVANLSYLYRQGLFTKVLSIYISGKRHIKSETTWKWKCNKIIKLFLSMNRSKKYPMCATPCLKLDGKTQQKVSTIFPFENLLSTLFCTRSSNLKKIQLFISGVHENVLSPTIKRKIKYF